MDAWIWVPLVPVVAVAIAFVLAAIFETDGWVNLLVVSALVALLVLVVHGGVAVNHVAGRHSCEAKGQTLDRDASYGFWKGCTIQADDGTYVPIDRFRVVELWTHHTTGSGS